MAEASATIRVRLSDKSKLEELCVVTHRAKIDMLAFLIQREHQQAIPIIRKDRKRKAG